MYFTVRYQMTHTDTIRGRKQVSTSSYSYSNVTQQNLPGLITELNEKGYELLSVHRADHP